MDLVVNGIMVVGAFLGIFFFLLILTKKRKCSSDYFLAVAFLLMGVVVFLHHIEMFNREFGYPYPWLIRLSTPFMLLPGLSLWLYVKSLTTHNFRLRYVDLLHLVPFIVVVVILAVKVYFLPPTLKVSIDVTSSFKLTLVVALIALSNVIYYFWGLYLLFQYRKKMDEEALSLKVEDLSWLRFILIASILIVGFLGIFNYADCLYDMVSSSFLEKVAFVGSSVYIAVVGFYGIQHNSILRNVREDVNIGIKRLGNDLRFEHDKNGIKATDEEKKFIEKLFNFMETNRPYVKQELTIAGLSALLNVSPEYLSFIINGHLGKNFFEFINAYRVAEFKLMCTRQGYKKYTLSAMAFECGFNSRATFNRVFKKAEGVSPSDYLAALDEENVRKKSIFEGHVLAM